MTRPGRRSLAAGWTGSAAWRLTGIVIVAGACLNPRPEELPSHVDIEGTPASESAGRGNASEGDTPAAGVLTPEEADPSTESPGLPNIGDVDAGPDAGAPTVSPPDGGAPAVE